MMNISNTFGDLTDISARTEALLASVCCEFLKRSKSLQGNCWFRYSSANDPTMNGRRCMAGLEGAVDEAGDVLFMLFSLFSVY